MPPLPRKEAEEFIKLRSPEWEEFQRDWRWLQDSLEGGRRYRDANYRDDPLGLLPGRAGLVFGSGQSVSYTDHVDRNLIPHPSEATTDGADVYAMRLARTPVPRNVSRSIHRHLARVYSKEVTRDGPKPILDWWEDVDGSGMKVDKWMRESIAPLFLVLGQIDLCFDHPAAPTGIEVLTEADAARLKTKSCVASYILPENLLNWEVDRQTRRYTWCLVYERCEGGARFRHWTAEESNAYDGDGKHIPDVSREHPFGRVPIVRVFDRRKHRCSNVGQSRYESIAELQKAIYNARSELILGDVQQSHAVLQGPQDYVMPGNAEHIVVGPNHTLPKKKSSSGPSETYEGWEYLEPPKGAQAEVRTHVLDFQDEADREAALLKPAGMTQSSTVAQSGISKVADSQEGNDVLSEVAETLADAERSIAALALVVLTDGRVSDADQSAITVTYPKEFGLSTAADLSAAIVELQGIAAAAGDLPECTAEGLRRLVATMYPGLSDEDLAELHREIDEFMDKKTSEAEMSSEARAASIDRLNAIPEAGSGSPQDGGNQPGNPMVNADASANPA